MSQNPTLPSLPGTGSQASSSTPYTSTRFTPLDPLRVLRQYMWLLIIAGLIGVGLGTVAAILFEKYTPEFTSRAMLMVGGELQSGYDPTSDPSGAAQGEGLSIFITNQIQRIKSQEILDYALSRPDVRATSWFKSFPSDEGARGAYEYLVENLAVTKVRGSSIIKLQFSGQQKDDLAEILQGVVDEFVRNYRTELGSLNSQLRIMMNTEKARSQEEQEDVEKELQQFLEDHDMPDIRLKGSKADIEFKGMAGQLLQLEQLLESYKQAYVQKLQEFNSQAPRRPEDDDAIRATKSISLMSEQLENLRRSRRLLSDKLGPNHPSMEQIDSSIVLLEDELNRKHDEVARSSERTMISMIEKNIEKVHVAIEAIKPRMAESGDRLRDLDAKITEYERIEKKLESADRRFEKAEKLLEDMRIKADRPEAEERIRMIQPPTVAELTFPNYPVTIVGMGFLFTAVSGGMVFLKEMLDQRVKSPADLRLVPDATLLGVLPAATEDPTGPESIEGIVHKDPAGLLAESFRQVRTEILARMDRRGYKSLLVVGTQAECGTSAVVSNLASSITFQDRMVVIVDANFRRPGQCKLFDVATTPGLAEVLRGDATLEEALVHNGDPKLDLLPAGDGSHTPPEVLESQAFRDLLNRLEEEYDVVLIDAAPALVAADARLLTKQTDAVTMVVRAKHEKRGTVGRMLTQLQGQRADLLGVILNGVQSSAGGYFRKNYQAFYRYRQPSKNASSVKSRDAEVIADSKS